MGQVTVWRAVCEQYSTEQSQVKMCSGPVRSSSPRVPPLLHVSNILLQQNTEHAGLLLFHHPNLLKEDWDSQKLDLQWLDRGQNNEILWLSGHVETKRLTRNKSNQRSVSAGEEAARSCCWFGSYVVRMVVHHAKRAKSASIPTGRGHLQPSSRKQVSLARKALTPRVLAEAVMLSSCPLRRSMPSL